MTTIQQFTTQEKSLADIQALREEVDAVWRTVEKIAAVANTAIQLRRKARLTRD